MHNSNPANQVFPFHLFLINSGSNLTLRGRVSAEAQLSSLIGLSASRSSPAAAIISTFFRCGSVEIPREDVESPFVLLSQYDRPARRGHTASSRTLYSDVLTLGNFRLEEILHNHTPPTDTDFSVSFMVKLTISRPLQTAFKACSVQIQRVLESRRKSLLNQRQVRASPTVENLFGEIHGLHSHHRTAGPVAVRNAHHFRF